MARLRRPTPTASLDPAAWMEPAEAREIFTTVSAFTTPAELKQWMESFPRRPWPFSFRLPLGQIYWYMRAGVEPDVFDPEDCALHALADLIAHRRRLALGADDDGWQPDDADVRALLVGCDTPDDGVASGT